MRRMSSLVRTAAVSLPSVVLLASLVPAAAGDDVLGPATSAGVESTAHAAEDRVRMDALQRAHATEAGSGAGCRNLPAGWASLDVTVNFPDAYNGYPAWVNSAELLPVADDFDAYLAGGYSPDAMVRPANRAASMSVRTSMCAPVGNTYWLFVDSGRQRIAIGRIKVVHTGSHALRMTAPPLGETPESKPVAGSPSNPGTDFGTPSQTDPVQQPVSGRPDFNTPSRSDPETHPDPVNNGCNPNIPTYRQPGCRSGSGDSAPGYSYSGPVQQPVNEPAPPPATQPAGQKCNPNIPHYSQPGCVD